MSKHAAPTNPFTFRQLLTPDAAAFRQIRLEGLRDYPQAFSAAWEEENMRPTEWFAERLESSFVLGAWHDATLVGIAGLYVSPSARQRHKNVLWGLYVQPQARGTGLARELLNRIIEKATTRAEEVLLSVAASNGPALRLYKSAGFKEYGLERRAFKLGDQYDDDILMALPLTRAKPS